MRPTPLRARWVTVTASLLLLARGLGDGALALAHTWEAPAAPVALGSPQHTDCVVMHDALRCAVCHVTGSGVMPAAAHWVPSADTRLPALPVPPDGMPPAAHARAAARPRAPPASRA